MISRVSIVLLALGLAAFAAPFLAELGRPRVGKKQRAGAGGGYAELPEGVTHYRWTGPEDGPVLVCIHGLTTPSLVWDGIAPDLAEAGFRVLTYDLWGRGLSDRPRGRQDGAFFTAQLSGLLSALGVEGPVSLMGYSMGGAIATAFAAQSPERVERLILVAPAGMVHNPGIMAEIARRVPVLGDWLMFAMGGRQLRKDALGKTDLPGLAGRVARTQIEQTRFRGYLPAVLASQRGILARPQKAEHRVVAGAGIPVLAIWGSEDTVIPLAAMGRLAEFNPAARQAQVEGADHALPVSHPVELIETLGTLLES